jgi:hypothetical protein
MHQPLHVPMLYLFLSCPRPGVCVVAYDIEELDLAEIRVIIRRLNFIEPFWKSLCAITTNRFSVCHHCELPYIGHGY